MIVNSALSQNRVECTVCTPKVQAACTTPRPHTQRRVVLRVAAPCRDTKAIPRHDTKIVSRHTPVARPRARAAARPYAQARLCCSVAGRVAALLAVSCAVSQRPAAPPSMLARPYHAPGPLPVAIQSTVS